MYLLVLIVCVNIQGVPCSVATYPQPLTEAACKTQLPVRIEMVEASLRESGYGDTIRSIEGFCHLAQGVSA